MSDSTRDPPPTNAFLEPLRGYKTDHQPPERAETPFTHIHQHAPHSYSTLTHIAPLLYSVLLHIPKQVHYLSRVCLSVGRPIQRPSNDLGVACWDVTTDILSSPTAIPERHHGPKMSPTLRQGWHGAWSSSSPRSYLYVDREAQAWDFIIARFLRMSAYNDADQPRSLSSSEPA